MPTARGFSKEERELMKKELTPLPVALFAGLAAVTSAIPVYMFTSILMLNMMDNVILYGVFTVLSTVALHLAYSQNTTKLKEWLQAKIGKQNDTMDMATLEKTAHGQAVWRAICFLNAIYFFSLLLFSTYIFRNMSGPFNYGASVTIASLLVSLLSTGSKRG